VISPSLIAAIDPNSLAPTLMTVPLPARLIRARDGQAIMELLTDRAVEERVMARVALKAATFGQDINVSPQTSGGGAPLSSTVGSSPAGTIPSDGAAGPQSNILPSVKKLKVRPELVADLYRNHVMPLTKEVELEYLLRRLD
jgi:chorismate mutase